MKLQRYAIKKVKKILGMVWPADIWPAQFKIKGRKFFVCRVADAAKYFHYS